MSDPVGGQSCFFMTEQDYNAGKLLDSLRAKAEDDLKVCAMFFGADKIGECPSQSLRAIHACDCIEQFLDVQRALGVAAFNQHVIDWIHIRDRLRDFLSVHRTVVLLEYEARKHHGILV